MRLKQLLAISTACVCGLSPLGAQEPFVEKPSAPIVWRPYKSPDMPPIILTDSDRLHALIRAGKLYLTLQDAIALAIENNLDLQVDRYGPLSAQWYLQRQHAGGPLRGVTSGSSAVNQITGGQGVLGAEQTAGLLSSTGASAGSNVNGSISQVGPITPNLDPVLQNSSTWSHQTTPQPNAIVSQTNELIDVKHSFQSFVQEGFLSGGYAQVAANESYLNENSPTDVLNPSVAPIAQIYATQNFLNGFGIGVNSRYIRVAQKQVTSSNITFRSQLQDLVANVVNLYWDLVSDQEDLKAKQRALDFAQHFYEDVAHEIAAGTVAGVDIYRSEAELSTRKQDFLISQSNVQQQENSLKSVLSRTGLADPMFDAAEVVCLDHIDVIQSDELPPLRTLLATALEKRPDVQLDKVNDEAQEISALGTANGILPTLRGIGVETNRSEAGNVNPISPYRPIPGQVGGLGNALGQIFRNDYKSHTGALVFQGTLGNRTAQGDYGIDQLQLRQGDLSERGRRNQLVVDISNDMTAIRQTSLRYRNAVDTRKLQQELLDKEQQKFSLGGSTIDNVINQQRSLVLAESAEVQALSGYVHARVALQQVTGETLEANRVSLDDALKGRIPSESKIPAAAPGTNR